MTTHPTLTSVGDNQSRLLFYPSSGGDVRWLFDYDYDIFVMSDHCRYFGVDRLMRDVNKSFKNEQTIIYQDEKECIFLVGQKICFMYFEDNNVTVNRLRESGKRISAFIGICDGCREGGNYECVNEKPFFNKVLGLMSSGGMMYMTDHSKLLYPDSASFWKMPPRPYHELIVKNLHFKTTKEAWDGWGEKDERGYHKIMAYCGRSGSRTFHVSLHNPTIYEWTNGRIRLSVEHDSIYNHNEELDGGFISHTCRDLSNSNKDYTQVRHYSMLPRYFFSPSKNETWSSDRSLLHLLNEACKQKWERVGAIAFGEGDHDNFLAILDDWNEEFPKHIRLFHMDGDDYSGLKSHLKKKPTLCHPVHCDLEERRMNANHIRLGSRHDNRSLNDI